MNAKKYFLISNAVVIGTFDDRNAAAVAMCQAAEALIPAAKYITEADVEKIKADNADIYKQVYNAVRSNPTALGSCPGWITDTDDFNHEYGGRDDIQQFAQMSELYYAFNYVQMMYEAAEILDIDLYYITGAFFKGDGVYATDKGYTPYVLSSESAIRHKDGALEITAVPTVQGLKIGDVYALSLHSLAASTSIDYERNDVFAFVVFEHAGSEFDLAGGKRLVSIANVYNMPFDLNASKKDKVGEYFDVQHHKVYGIFLNDLLREQIELQGNKAGVPFARYNDYIARHSRDKDDIEYAFAQRWRDAQ